VTVLKQILNGSAALTNSVGIELNMAGVGSRKRRNSISAPKT
jgi:hypothetical protein